MEAKIWKVRCVIGMERTLVAQLLLKAIAFFNSEKPFMILSIFTCDKTVGCLYIEAHNMNHVQIFINGMSGIFHGKIEMIPYPEMPQVLRACTELSQTALQPH